MQKNTPQYIKKCADRQKAMRQERKRSSLTYAELGDIWGISPQRAYQIVNAKTIEVVNT